MKVKKGFYATPCILRRTYRSEEDGSTTQSASAPVGDDVASSRHQGDIDDVFYIDVRSKRFFNSTCTLFNLFLTLLTFFL